MTKTALVGHDVRTGYSSARDASTATRELTSAFGDIEPTAVMFFCSPELDGALLCQQLCRAYPDVPIIGCTTAGEFTERRAGNGGVSAVALPGAVVRRAGAALADLRNGVEQPVAAALKDVEAQLGTPLGTVVPGQYVGFVLIDGLHGHEEHVNTALAGLAPAVSFVGGSAGDDLRFTRTRVFRAGSSSDHGVALLVAEAAVAFTVVKTCSFRPTERRLRATSVDVDQRIVWEFDGRPAAQVYAEAVGCAVDELPVKGFLSHPLGLMIDGEPWIRSPQQIVGGRGVKFYCQMTPGMEVNLMEGTDLLGDTRAALRQAASELGDEVSGGVLFNCILRRLELDTRGLHDRFIDTLDGIRVAGFHTYGESCLRHINQTLTGVLFGK